MDSSTGIDFLFDGGAAGVLDPATIPDIGGVLIYIPYRSGSHHNMHQAINAGDGPTCTFVHDDVQYSFVVDSCPAYGQLGIRDLRVVQAD